MTRLFISVTCEHSLMRVIRHYRDVVVYAGLVGLAQGIRRIFVQFGLILGPLWAGSMLQQPYLMFGIMLAINLLLTVSIMHIFQATVAVAVVNILTTKVPCRRIFNVIQREAV